jgi:hypothetical protein
MTAGPALAFPGSRTLAGWWRQLSPLRPEALRVGHLLLHHVEALTRLRATYRPGDFPLLVLRALALESPGRPHPSGTGNNHAGEAASEGQLRRLDRHLGLGRPLLLQVLQDLTRRGLAEHDPRTGWAVAGPGRQALAHGEVPHESFERRAFYFLEREGAAAGERPPPAFLPLRLPAGAPWPAAADWGFDVHVLRSCLDRPAAWKQRSGFPAEVAEVVLPDRPAEPLPADVPAWQRVAVDRPEHLAVVLAAVPGEAGSRLVGFAVRQDGWHLDTEEPLLSLAEGWAEDLPDLAAEPAAEDWRVSWRQWCQQRGLPAAEADASELKPAGVVLRVRPGTRLLERLREARSDALKGDAWLLAGEGRVRAAARVEVVEGAAAEG